MAVPREGSRACCVPALSVVNPMVIVQLDAAVMPGLATPVTWSETSELAPPSAAWQLYVPPSGPLRRLSIMLMAARAVAVSTSNWSTAVPV